MCFVTRSCDLYGIIRPPGKREFAKLGPTMAQFLEFGKYKNKKKTLEWLFFHDPGYVWWMIDNGAEKNLRGGERERFHQLVRRAKHLAIPGNCRHCSRPISRMSLSEHSGGGLARVDFFCDGCDLGGARSVLTTPAFYTPDFFRNYDKLGATFLVDAIKSAYFGSNARMTQARMEEFFRNPANFVNP